MKFGEKMLVRICQDLRGGNVGKFDQNTLYGFGVLIQQSAAFIVVVKDKD